MIVRCALHSNTDALLQTEGIQQLEPIAGEWHTMLVAEPHMVRSVEQCDIHRQGYGMLQLQHP